jgi:hypothetical protein
MNQSVNHLPEQVLTMSPVYTEGAEVGQNILKNHAQDRLNLTAKRVNYT